MSILVNVVGQKMLVSSGMENVVAGSQKFVKFRFNLSEEWDGLLVFAQFTQHGKAYNQYLDEENVAYLPPEIGVIATKKLDLVGVSKFSSVNVPDVKTRTI